VFGVQKSVGLSFKMCDEESLVVMEDKNVSNKVLRKPTIMINDCYNLHYFMYGRLGIRSKIKELIHHHKVLVLEDWSENCGTFSLWALHRNVSDLCPFILKATNIDWGSKTS